MASVLPFFGTNFGEGSIISSGLQLHYDAGNPLSYPGSGTNWANLVTSSLSGLGGTPAFSSANKGSIVFDGVNDYLLLPTINTNANFTMEWWFRRADDPLGYAGIFAGTGGNYLQVRVGSDHVSLVNSFIAELGNFGVASGTVTGTINHVVLTLSGTTYSCYVNGSFIRTLVFSSTYTTTSPTLGNNGGSEWFKGNIYIFRQYSTVLTAANVLQNFNAQRSRFNI